ncbi:zinc ribbon domain-containing protein [Mariniphaga sp.]|uniref:zinc ribbon domain-containing protein n=1 Tax=Mariniphaga sp. TaxID=1954475 RepID=UPI00356A9174
MKRCQNCGVESEENANFCSLCGEPLLDKITENSSLIRSGKTHREEKLLTDYQRLTGFQKRKIFWQISGLILISGIIITLLIDFIENRTITWSKYPATISLVLFINFTLNTFLRNKITLMVALSFLSVTGLFILFDVYAGDTGWEIKLGIPLLLAFYITLIILIYLIRNAKQKGMNVIAYSMIAAGVLCICIEGMISIYFRSSVYVGWSLIVMVSVVLIAMLLLFIHYRLKKATDLKRFFHI